MKASYLLYFLFGVFFYLQAVAIPVFGGSKPRVVVMSDISTGNQEPDDKQSFVRLLLYSNELDIEGLIGATSVFDSKDGSIDRGDVIVFYNVLDVYDEIRPNLVKHTEGYPTAEALRSVVFEGNLTANGMTGVGAGMESEGSNHIKALLQDKSNLNPIWFLGWGGISTLAQAVYELESSLSATEFSQVLRKIRIYDIYGQDDCGAALAEDFPELLIIRSVSQFNAFSQRNNSPAPLSQEGDLSRVGVTWFRNNIQSNHGVYGAMYPDRVYMFEGDTPSFMYLINNGLGSPDDPHFGGWGGRFSRTKNGAGMFVEENDVVQYNGSSYNTKFSSLWRWRNAYQNDFAARMDWTTTNDYGAVNHAPKAIVGSDATTDVLYITASPSETLSLNASASNDPDGNDLSFQWWYYKEAGTFDGDVVINGSNNGLAKVTIPADTQVQDSLHFILSLSDNGSPALTSYRRVVVVVDQREPVNILLLGNSLTQAQQGHNSYRRPLWHMLDASGYDVDFVGSLSTVYSNKAHPNPDFDTDHEGHWGWRADQINASLTGWLAHYDADITLLMIGSNDLGAGDDIEQVCTEITAIVSKLRTDNEDMVILLGNLPPTSLPRSEASVAFNAALPDFIEGLTTNKSPVFLVNHYRTMTMDMFYDGIHPYPEGEQVMAENWFSALQAYFEGRLAEVPEAPGNLMLEVNENDHSLSWSDNSWNEKAFVIERSGDGLLYDVLAEVANGELKYSYKTSGAPVFYRVKAINRYGGSTYSNVIVHTATGVTAFDAVHSTKYFDVYQNGLNDLIKVSCESIKGSKTVDLYDVSGRLLKTFVFDDSQTVFSSAGLCPGIYCVVLTCSENVRLNRKIILL